MNINLIYITAGNKAEARTLGRELVESKLAACVNIIDNMNSMYVWQGEIQDDKEVVLIAKTTEAKVPELLEKVKALHSYDCPCILSIPVSGGNKEFMDWIANEVK
ncbi:MAG: divalent-cation tolerance protein CutA [Deltaproteobacteria bacterium]|nr:MAG: divalent-cation tolerance protein CutA [Deltaproteobacteria bacterium]